MTKLLRAELDAIFKSANLPPGAKVLTAGYGDAPVGYDRPDGITIEEATAEVRARESFGPEPHEREQWDPLRGRYG